MKTYEQLTYEQRCQIYALKKTGLSQSKIATIIGTTQTTICREYKRNSGAKGYRHSQAQKLAEARRSQTHKPLKMNPEMIIIIEEKLEER